MEYAFPKAHEKWVMEEIVDLYGATLIKDVAKQNKALENNLKEYAKKCNVLVLWLDCDREGENIAFEVIDVVKKQNPKIEILRAHFSALTDRDIFRAVNNLVAPDKNQADAVDIRQRIDLIIGASFTRLQSLLLRNVYERVNMPSQVIRFNYN